MKKTFHEYKGIIFALAVITGFAFLAAGCGVVAEGTNLAKKPAIEARLPESPAEVAIEQRIVMARSGPVEQLERPPVVFDHGRHVNALKDEGCQVCHPAGDEGTVTYEFLKWTEGEDRKAFAEKAHEKCLKCHGGAKPPVKAKGLGCGECHVDSLEYETVGWYQPAFDHANHIDAMEQGCDTCHHQYDEELEKLVYVKGQETTCGECHKEEHEGNRESLRKVAHTQCIGCHERQYLAGETKLDPYSCRECHRPEARPRRPEAMRFAMRPFESHPTKLLITYPDSILPPVPFDHEKHDPKKDCSKCCHHFHVRMLVGMDPRFEQTGQACRQCHEQVEVSTRAGCIRPDKIYHDAESPDTCVGCHTEKNQTEEAKAPVSCKECHTGGEAVARPVALETEASPEEGPETYIIARLSRQYMPVKFPHSRHSEMLGNCDACHHYSPANQKPTCNACHGAPGDFSKLTKPRLVSAYHRMCIGCHRNMGIGPITCSECHEERELVYSPGQQLQTSMMINGASTPSETGEVFMD